MGRCPGWIRLRCRPDLAAVQGICRPFHWTPWEVFAQHCPGESAGAEELTVVSWVLPSERRSAKPTAGQEVSVRRMGPDQGLRRGVQCRLASPVADRLKQVGHAAIAPMLAPNWTVVKSERFSYASSWSERHAAHAAGLGTFGLCDGLITARGKAMRVGSVVAKISIQPTPGLIRTTAPIACFSPMERAANALTVVRPAPLPKQATTGEMPAALGSLEGIREKNIQVRRVWLRVVSGGCSCEARIPVKAAGSPGARGVAAPPPPLA